MKTLFLVSIKTLRRISVHVTPSIVGVESSRSNALFSGRSPVKASICDKIPLPICN